jgi:predicted MFS family arabinose efflux permease
MIGAGFSVDKYEARASIGIPSTLGQPEVVSVRAELRSMSAIAFLVFYSNSMIAPLIPALARGFGVHPYDLKWLIPGFSMLYGAATLLYGILSDRFGRYPVLRILLAFGAVATFSLSFAMSAQQLVLLRILSAAGTGGIATIALSIIGDHYPYTVQGRPMGRMYGAVAAGMGLGSSLGPLLNPLLGWRNELRILALGFGAAAYWVTRRFRNDVHPTNIDDSLWNYALEYRCILDAPRGGRTLAFIFANGAFHGGIFAWLGVLLAGRYHLGEIGIGLVLAGYGMPNLIFGAVIGSWGDRHGRRYVVPLGFLVASICALLLTMRSTPLISALIVTTLSAGFVATHPLMSSITTSLDPKHRGQITGLATFSNFVGTGLGALVFGRLMVPHFGVALVCFGCVEFAVGVLAFYAFRSEVPVVS